MIDMRGYFTHSDYPSVVETFEASFDKNKLNCDDYWFAFTDLQKKISNNRCPICEVEFNEFPNKTNTATLDHFRPKNENMYPALQCEPKNYLVLCSLCNNTYKDNKFPLFDESKRTINSQSIEETRDEEPLIFNPIEKNPLEFFKLFFVQTPQGGMMELEPQSSDKESYEYKMSDETIKMFSLNYCNEEDCKYKRKERNPETDKMEVINVTEKSNMILREHYSTFIQLAQAIEAKDKKAYILIMSNKNRKKELESYGFYHFIMNKQFRIL